MQQQRLRMTKQRFLVRLRRALDWPELEEGTALRDDARWDSLACVHFAILAQREIGRSPDAMTLAGVRHLADALALIDLT